MRVPENNSLKKEIEELLHWCNVAEEKNEKSSSFDVPVSEKELVEWEEKNGVKIPETFKEWLRFSRKCNIANGVANFWGPDEFNSDYVPDDLVVIGEMIGDGERVCFSKITGNFIRFFENDDMEEYDDFGSLLNKIMRILGKRKVNSHKKEVPEEKMLEIKKKRGLI